MELKILDRGASHVHAGYDCPCGCTPSVEYTRGSGPASEGCCCGNTFAVGPDAAAGLRDKSGYRRELQVFDAPWGERLEAAWSIGASVHGPAPTDHTEHGQEHEHDSGHAAALAIDPVCGMSVAPDVARAKSLHSSFQGRDFFFCGKGCKLEFDEDPDRYLDPGYVPSM